MRKFLELLNEERNSEVGENLSAFKARMEREQMVYEFILNVENEKLRLERGIMSRLAMNHIESELMDVLGNAPSNEVAWGIVCLMADTKPLKEMLIANAEDIYLLFPEKHTEFLELFSETVFEIFAALLKNGNAFSGLLQNIADYSYEFNSNQVKELEELVHENLYSIIANVLNNEANENILHALWLLENRFNVSYDELREAVEDDVSYAPLYRCDEYPECWMYSYYLVKPGYDYFYERRDELVAVYPKAARKIVVTFPYMEAE